MGFIEKGHEGHALKLKNALYNLRQAPRAWNTKLDKCLQSLGFIRCPMEHVVYKRREGDAVQVVGVYVDDLIITGSSIENIGKFKE